MDVNVRKKVAFMMTCCVLCLGSFDGGDDAGCLFICIKWNTSIDRHT